MASMFDGCSKLKKLNLSNFNTDKVTMGGMFLKCSSLKDLNLLNFNTKNVTNMFSMFTNCSSLKELIISNFNIDNVTIMISMFYGCSDEFQMKIKSKYPNLKEEAFEDVEKYLWGNFKNYWKIYKCLILLFFYEN